MEFEMIISLLKRVLVWISTRLKSEEIVEDLEKTDEENPGVSVQEEQQLQIIDKPAHSDNYGDRPAGMPINLIVLHYTATGSLDSTVRWFQNPDAKVSAHYVIGQDGTFVRMVPENKKAYHAGKSEWKGQKNVNRFSIGIELVNWGKLVKSEGQFYFWPNNYTSPYNGSDPVFLEDAWWEPYPETQLDSLNLLIDDIKSRYSIDDVVGHRDVSPRRKLDPGPAFYLHDYMDILNII